MNNMSAASNGETHNVFPGIFFLHVVLQLNRLSVECKTQTVLTSSRSIYFLNLQ
jgi:hypothetical protein